MAQRRMFSLKVIDTDLFLDMPLSTQALYFHLSMRADDDGFIGNQKKIMRMVGASDDDMKILIAKQLIIPFESGVCVVRHWRVHNYIQKDRYNSTFYKAEKAQLLANSNVYEKTEYLDTKCIHDVSKPETQVRLELGKDRLELREDSIDIEEVTNYIGSSENLKQFSRLYEQNIGLINGISGEWLKEMSESIDYKLFKRAIEIATDKNKCRLDYIKGIIKQWTDKNITTYDQLKAYELQINSKKGVKSDVRGREGDIETESSEYNRESEEARRRELFEQSRQLEQG